MNNKMKSSNALVLIVYLIFLAACTKQNEIPIRIGINAWPGYEFLYLAEQKKFYEAEGVAVEIVQYSSSSDSKRAFERGSIDGVAVTLVEVLQSQEEDRQLPQAVLVTDYSNGADFVVARSEIKSIAELKGKKIGVEFGSVGVYILASMLNKGGLTLADIKMVSFDQTSLEYMFDNNELDAAVTYLPVAVSLLKKADVNILFTSADIPGEVLDVVAMNKTITEEHPEKIAAIIRAFFHAVEYTQQHPDEAYQIMSDREGLDSAEFRKSLTGKIHVVTSEEQREYFTGIKKISSTLLKVDATLRSANQLKGNINFDTLVNDKPLRLAGLVKP